MDGGPETERERDPFGAPMAGDPAAEGLDRVGVVDVGSNSIRLVVFDGAARSPAYFYNEKVMAGLGIDLALTGRLHPEGRARALAALRRFALLAEGMRLPPLTAVATAAVRTAADGPAFAAEVLRETGIALRVIDGDEEARLSAQGVLLGWPAAEGLVSDLGGSSMELVRVGAGRVWERATTGLGPLRLEALAGGPAERAQVIEAELAALRGRLDPQARLYLVGGSWRAIARLDMHRRGYPLHVLHDYRMTPADVRATLDWLRGLDLEALRREVGLSGARIAHVPVAGEVLRRLISTFRIRRIVTSAYGLREGVLYERMPQRVRVRDPLIEAARHAEQLGARMPGFGDMLYRFLEPLFPAIRTERRLVRAACLLHDVSWRAHPDYRAEVGFDHVTQGNLGGIDHAGRVFLGLAMLHRYRNARPGHRFEPLVALLPPERVREAEILGKAMRFGAMFSLAVPDRMGELRFRPQKRELELRLPPAAAPLYGEVAAARFDSLARALDSRAIVTMTRR